MSSQPPDRSLLNRAFRIIMVEGVLIAALAMAVAYLLLLRPPQNVEQALLDPGIRRAALQMLVEDSKAQGLMDTFPDPDVGRVLLPAQKRTLPDGRQMRTNLYGMRERDYPLPKPAGTTRVVLLGDSFIFGLGLDQADRACSFLEPWLRERAQAPGLEVECLQLGVGSWNVRSEAAYLRRQLSLLQPDAVVHLVLQNDLGDAAAARGFGVTANYSDQHRDRANGMVTADFARRVGFPEPPYRPLLWGVDHESRTRYAEAAREISRLAEAIRAQEGRYLLLMKWSQMAGTARDLLIAKLPRVEVRYLPHRFSNAREHTLSETNRHWNRAGNEAVARYLFGWIEKEGVLPGLRLRSWTEAAELYEALKSEGEQEARSALSGEELARKAGLVAEIGFAGLDLKRAAQIYGGIDRQGVVSVYASLVLARRGGTRLLVAGRGLGRREIEGATLTVFADEEALGTIAVPWDGPFRFEKPLPSGARERAHLAVRLSASDYAYVGPELRECALLRLERVAVLP